LRCQAGERQALEPLCRRLHGPVLAIERVQCNAAGHAALGLKTPWPDGTMHLAMSPS
jgi:hypothetical protein